MIPFSEKRWLFLSISALLVITALVILAIPPRLVRGIEFTSGSSFTLRFSEQVSISELRTALTDVDHPEARVQETGEREYLIRTSVLEGAPALDSAEPGPAPSGEIDVIEEELRNRFGEFERVDFATVSSSVSSQIGVYATFAVAASALAILLYLTAAFRKLGVRRSAKYGACAVIALVHDAVIVLGFYSLMGKWLGSEVDTAFITAILTVIGFSVHDTIVVFDRIREVIEDDPFIPMEEAVNASLTETLPRSLNTSITLLVTISALLLIGGDTIRDFLLVLLVGVAAGTYSSIGVAAQILVAWERGDVGRGIRRLFGRSGERAPESAGVEPAG